MQGGLFHKKKCTESATSIGSMLDRFACPPTAGRYWGRYETFASLLRDVQENRSNGPPRQRERIESNGEASNTWEFMSTNHNRNTNLNTGVFRQN
jgi:hypothetical protein